jgi:RNA polymerase sigma-70 factor (ECF subfamily)
MTVVTRHEVQLVLRAQYGDLEALEELLRKVQGSLLGYISRLVGRSDAEDVLQDVFLQICRKLIWLREPELFRPWIFRVSSRAAFAFLRRKRRWSEKCDAEVVMEDLPAPVQKDLSELACETLELLDKISPASRAVLLLHYFHDLTLVEVAAILEISTGTVKSRLAYGLSSLRDLVKREK